MRPVSNFLKNEIGLLIKDQILSVVVLRFFAVCTSAPLQSRVSYS